MDPIVPQQPAEGIAKYHDWEDSKWYKINCTCNSPEHECTMNVEVDDFEITVHLYMDTQTAWWKDHCQRHFDWLPYNVKYFVNRVINSFSLAYNAVVKGYVKQDGFVSLSKQSAMNLSAVLVDSISDVEKFAAIRQAKYEAEQKAKQKDESK